MLIIVMGVSGSGKTTIGRLLGQRLSWPFYDGDDFLPPDKIAKMASGIPLDDSDRLGWLQALAALIRTRVEAGENGVIACSALKQSYRELLTSSYREQVKFVYLRGSYEIIARRMKARRAHFMKPAMLQSQFAILEEPTGVLTVDITRPPEEIVEKIVAQVVTNG